MVDHIGQLSMSGQRGPIIELSKVDKLQSSVFG